MGCEKCGWGGQCGRCVGGGEGVRCVGGAGEMGEWRVGIGGQGGGRVKCRKGVREGNYIGVRGSGLGIEEVGG